MKLIANLIFLLPFCAQAFSIKYNVGVAGYPERRASVQIKIDGWREPKLQFTMPTRFGPADDLSKLLSQVEVRSNGENKKVNIIGPTIGNSNTTYEVLNVTAGTLEIRYLVNPADYKEFWNLGSVYNVIQKDHAAIKGVQTFVRISRPPNEFEKIQIHFDVPVGWSVFCPSIQLNDTTCGIEDSVNVSERELAITSNVYALGHWQKKETTISGVSLNVLRAGEWSLNLNDFFEVIEGPLRWQVSSMGSHNRKIINFVVDTYPEDIQISGWSAAGECLHDSTFSLVMRNLTKEEFLERALHVAVHEFNHTFGWKYSDNRGQIAWFDEGSADYMAYMSLLESGVLPVNSAYKAYQFLIEKSYWNQDAVREMSILDVSNNRWEDSASPLRQVQKEDILYRKTTLLAMAMDGMALKAGSQKTFRDVLGLLWSRYGYRGQSISLEIILAAVYEVMGREIKDFFADNLLSTKELDVGEMLRMRGVDFTVLNVSDLGIVVYDSQDGPTIVDFRRGMNRQKISQLGLKVGDLVKSLDGRTIPSAWDFEQMVAHLSENQTVDLGVERDGKTLRSQIRVRGYRKLNLGRTTRL